MPLEAEQYAGLSPSTHRALGYALAAARHRDGDGAVEPADLLVGALVAHARGLGEVQALLGHFDLTVRDVVPDSYPQLPADELERRVAGISLDGPPPMSPQTEQALLGAVSLSRDGRVHIRHVVGSLLDATDLRTRLESALSASGVASTRVMDAYRGWLSQPLDGSRSAGEQLAAWLAAELPRRPVEVPTYAADTPESTGDLVGVQTEVDAFAYLLASKALRPPLAVGLFGEWGSGKSFFMNAVERRVAEISREAGAPGAADSPFWGVVEQISFNAWEYAQSELWASVVHHIFKALEGQPSQLVDARREDLDAEQRSAASDIERLDQALRAANTDVQRAQSAVQDAEHQRMQAIRTLRERRAGVLDEALRERAGKALAAAWDRDAERLLGKDGKDLVGAIADARGQLARSRGLLGLYWTRAHIAIATAIALLVPVLVLVLDLVGVPPATAVLGGLLPLVPAVTAMLRSATTWSRERLAQIETITREIDARFEAEVEAEKAKVARARDELDAALASRASAQAERRELERRTRRIQDQIDALTPSAVLAEFLSDRARSEAYRRHLGLLSRVRDDLENLESLMRLHNEARLHGETWHGEGKPPPDRIILYIDDLDRCPSDKVVEVLEAVHLLLAFELFVVVVAVDSRWLSFALTDELKALTTENSEDRRPTPQDYLEKIFQLPFWVQPLLPAGRSALARRLLEGSVRGGAGDAGDGGKVDSRLGVGEPERDVLEAMLARRGSAARLDAHALTLLPSDLQFMDALAPLLGDTPRRVKRFVNVVQLLLAMPPELAADGPAPTPREVVMFLAALNSGLPEVAAALFAAVDNPRGRGRTLGDVRGWAAPASEDLTTLTTWLEANEAWKAVTLDRLAIRLDLVRRLGFTRPALA